MVAIVQLYVDTGVLQNTTYPLAIALVGAATVFGFGMLNLYSLHALSAYVRNMPTMMLGWTTAFAAARFHHHEEVHKVYLSMFLNAGWLGGLLSCSSPPQRSLSASVMHSCAGAKRRSS